MTGFVHTHPYQIFIPQGAEKLIIGTLPPPRFTQGRLKKRDVDFCYGSCDGMLWPVLEEIFGLSLKYDNSPEAVRERREFLAGRKIGICDIVASCLRDKIDASDLGMREIKLRNILEQLRLHPCLSTLIFTGGNTRNGPEYLFRRQLRENGMVLRPLSKGPPREHSFTFLEKTYTTISLTSPSNAANRAIGANPLYKRAKNTNPEYSTFDFRVDQYRAVFQGGGR